MVDVAVLVLALIAAVAGSVPALQLMLISLLARPMTAFLLVLERFGKED